MSFNGAQGSLQLGDLKLYIGKPNSTMTSEFWAKQATDKIMSVAETAPMPIREQAMAFKAQIFRAVLHVVNEAVKERRVRDAKLAEEYNAALSDKILAD